MDGTNLERNLYLTSQLLEVGIPLVIAINMMDVVKKNGDKINTEILSEKLGVPVTTISALKEDNTLEAARLAAETARKNLPIKEHRYSGSVEHALAHIEEITVHHLPDNQQRWYAIKLFERDERVYDDLHISEEIKNHIENDIEECEKENDDESDSIIINERYNYIESVLKTCYRKNKANLLSISDKIDKLPPDILVFRYFCWQCFWSTIFRWLVLGQSLLTGPTILYLAKVFMFWALAQMPIVRRGKTMTMPH